MTRFEWLIVIILPFLLTWGIDRVTKLWAMSLDGVLSIGPLAFVLHHNHGAMLGLFSTTPPIIRIVSLSTAGAFLIFFFMTIQYLLPISSKLLRSGMSVLLGGILGNVFDRIVYGYVTDFITFKGFGISSPVFNLADSLQFVGYGMIAAALIRDGEILWPTENARKNQWVNPPFQLRYCFILLGVGLGFAAIAGVFSYTFLRVTIIEFGGSHPTILDNYLQPFVLAFMVVTLTFAGALFVVGKSLSARIAGPMYAFERFLDDLMAGRPRPLRLRTGDEFQSLEKIAARITAELTRLSDEANRPPNSTSSIETPAHSTPAAPAWHASRGPDAAGTPSQSGATIPNSHSSSMSSEASSAVSSAVSSEANSAHAISAGSSVSSQIPTEQRTNENFSAGGAKKNDTDG